MKAKALIEYKISIYYSAVQMSVQCNQVKLYEDCTKMSFKRSYRLISSNDAGAQDHQPFLSPEMAEIQSLMNSKPEVIVDERKREVKRRLKRRLEAKKQNIVSVKPD